MHNKLSVGFDCLGKQEMKNVVPVISYQVTMGGVGDIAFPLTKALLPKLERLQPRKLANGLAPDTSDPRG